MQNTSFQMSLISLRRKAQSHTLQAMHVPTMAGHMAACDQLVPDHTASPGRPQVLDSDWWPPESGSIPEELSVLDFGRNK